MDKSFFDLHLVLFIRTDLALYVTAHEKNAEIRIKNYSHTIERLKMRSAFKLLPFCKRRRKNTGRDVTEIYDNIFWFGDFNFRLEDTTEPTIRRKIEEKQKIERYSFSSVVAFDQLHRIMNRGILFRGFRESPITFPPTYKYDIGTDTYDTSHKNRVPSYTDRILYKFKISNDKNVQPVNCLLYDHVGLVKCSDHKPVRGVFSTQIFASLELKNSNNQSFYGRIYEFGNKKLNPLSLLKDFSQNLLKTI
ncbi:inositol polyphosphate 5-phosphatase E-like isoform X1 [Gordionus sp. m RMFG-2023]|uniref:inositol polyphosphate 5-phosphatase E-like isoform X1 n=2 Tax=Gordionus sp. m RMFG-2023 TaxID=3053472 RepID=UPI0031FD3BD8